MSNNLYVIIHQNGGENGVQMNGGEMNNGQLNNNQSSGCQINQLQDQINRGQMNEGRTKGQDRCLVRDPDRDQTNAGQMITARNLKIEHSEKYEHWEWVSDPRETRFTELAELLQVWWLSIKARKNFLELSANTKYGAYLIFRTKQDSEGLDAIQKASVSVGGKGSKKYVCLKPTTAMPPSVGLPIKTSDGWMELELGQFECDSTTGDKDAVISIEETKDDNKKSGLIVAGIEIRPI